MKKVYFLSTCSTCQRIMNDLDIETFEKQEIKTQPITPDQLDEMHSLSGSYEALFSRRAIKYKSMGLKDQKLSEKDLRRLILEEYTFLKRPVFIVDDKIFIGNAAAEIDRLKAAI